MSRKIQLQALELKFIRRAHAYPGTAAVLVLSKIPQLMLPKSVMISILIQLTNEPVETIVMNLWNEFTPLLSSRPSKSEVHQTSSKTLITKREAIKIPNYKIPRQQKHSEMIKLTLRLI